MIFIIAVDIDQFRTVFIIRILGEGWVSSITQPNNITVSLDQTYISIPKELNNLINVKDIVVKYFQCSYYNKKYHYGAKQLKPYVYFRSA